MAFTATLEVEAGFVVIRDILIGISAFFAGDGGGVFNYLAKTLLLAGIGGGIMVYGYNVFSSRVDEMGKLFSQFVWVTLMLTSLIWPMGEIHLVNTGASRCHNAEFVASNIPLGIVLPVGLIHNSFQVLANKME